MFNTSFCEVTHTLPVHRVLSGIDMDFLLKVLISVVLLSTNMLTAAPRKPRLTLAAPNPSYYYKDVDGISGTYAFGYDVSDPETGNSQFRTEEKYPNGTVVGSYGYVDPRGRSRRFDYIADENGYRLLNAEPVREKYVQSAPETKTTSTEPTVSWTRPRRPNKKKTKQIKAPSVILEPPILTILD